LYQAWNKPDQAEAWRSRRAVADDKSPVGEPP
jgi:hypothetical protein